MGSIITRVGWVGISVAAAAGLNVDFRTASAAARRSTSDWFAASTNRPSRSDSALGLYIQASGATQLPGFFLRGALPGPVGAGLAWLENNQSVGGSWGNDFPLIVTATVLESLKAVDPGSTALITGAAWLGAETAPNYEFLARQVIALAGVPGHEAIAADLAEELVAVRNPPTTNLALPNWPEGGWGLESGYETDCLTTALALKALDSAGLNGGFKVLNRSSAPATTNTHEWDIASNATKVRLLVSVGGSTIRVRMKQGVPPTPGDPFFNLPPGNWLITFPDSGLPFSPGHNFITVQNTTGVAATYSMTASFETPILDTRALDEALEYLRQSQNVDGGWGIQRGQPTEIYTTLHVLLTLLDYAHYEFSAAITQGTNFVRGQQLGDGSFGYSGTGIPYVTALAALTLIHSESYPFSTDVEDAVSYLLSAQAMDGSWDQEAYDTALAILALWDRDQPPAANAGPDQNVTDADETCVENVTLSGSATDLDGTIVSYTWTENGNGVALGASPVVPLTVGVHTLTLTVMDDMGKEDSDVVVITVEGTGVPSTACSCCLTDGTCQSFDATGCALSGGAPAPGACTGDQACCLSDRTCQMLDPLCCMTQNGTPFGPGSLCTPVEACCLPDGSCAQLDVLCCFEDSGAPQGPGSTCGNVEACCLSDDTCQNLATACCIAMEGTSQGSSTACTATQACCLDGGGACQNLDPECCEADGGVPGGSGTTCTAPVPCCMPDHSCQLLDPECCVASLGQPGTGACDPPQACCLGNGSCALREPECCADEGGTAQGVGTSCSAVQACCLPDGSCQLLDPLCCFELDGSSQGDGSVCGVVEACCFPDGTCQDIERCQCMSQNGALLGPGSICAGMDANENGIDDACDTCTCQLYGDVVDVNSQPMPDCQVDVSDLLCVLDDFADSANCAGQGDIIAADFSCVPDGIIDVTDILAELDAFSGAYSCDHPCPP